MRSCCGNWLPPYAYLAPPLTSKKGTAAKIPAPMTLYVTAFGRGCVGATCCVCWTRACLPVPLPVVCCCCCACAAAAATVHDALRLCFRCWQGERVRKAGRRVTADEMVDSRTTPRPCWKLALVKSIRICASVVHSLSHSPQVSV